MGHRHAARHRHTALMISALFAAALAAGCGESSGFQAGALPVIELRIDGQSVPDGGSATVQMPSEGERIVGSLQLVNTGTGVLRVDALTLDATPAGSLRLSLPTLPLELPPAGQDSESLVSIPLIAAATDGQGATPDALLTVSTNRLLSGGSDASIRLLGARPAGQLEVSPHAVDFGTQGVGEHSRDLALLVTGGAPVAVESMVLRGDPNFGVDGPDGLVWVDELGPDKRILFDPPLVITPGQVHTRRVAFRSTTGAGAVATLELHTADGLARSVALSANTHAPCLIAAPARVEFGTRLVGQASTLTLSLRSCGTGDVTISEIALDPATHEGFGVPEYPSLPLTLAPNETFELPISYLPLEESPLAPGDGADALLADHGVLTVRSNAPVAELSVPLSGAGALSIPPTAVIVIAEGEEVIPQTRLHLSGTQSYGAAPIKRYQWTVDQPAGSVSALLPSPYAPEPTFDANVAGVYRFTLIVEDESGAISPVAAEAVVHVIPDEAIHIELLWDTPGDPNQGDEGPEAGADMDLHFVHPFAAGDGWFDIPFDAFWFNAHPNWGALPPQIDDNPGLDRDDTDGGGPENVNLALPEEGLTYKVGVHYWNDHGFGPSTATLRVYIYDELSHEASCPMLPLDLWDAARILWPSGEVEGVGSGGDCVVTHKVTPEGFFVGP
ncbi:MAG: choice-of-anchor D domain-containing protein [Myxococcota bacterium]